MKQCLFVSVLLLVFTIQLSASDLSDLVDELVATDIEEHQKELIEEIIAHEPSPKAIISLLKTIRFPKPQKIGIVTEEIHCIDGHIRPFCWYIPESYDPSKRSPLLVYLHGAVGREKILEDPETYVRESPFLALADTEGYILLFPLGQAGATWWDSVGVENVLAQIRTTRKRFNIDDNRVFMTGFSDGASGSFFFGMCHPTDFAAFLPLNGHPGVGSIDGGIQTYFVNLFNRPLSVINTDEDALYPSEKMAPMMRLALDAGADLLFRIYRGIPHTFEYAETEIPRMLAFIKTHPRIPHPPLIKWETVEKRHGRCDWLALETVRPGEVPEWYEDHNMELIDDRVSFGFYPDDEYEGEGIRMGKIVDSTFVSLAGAREGDIIISVEGDSVTGMQVLNNYKAKKNRGDPAEVTVLRDDEKLVLKGHFPPATTYNLFLRDKPSARAEALFSANIFHIRASQLGSLSINIHPDMVQMDQPVLVFVNDTLRYEGKVEQDVEFLLKNFLEHRDRELLYVNRISIHAF
jgi:poly(3-hydroxybutyrate) depolymerase